MNDMLDFMFTYSKLNLSLFQVSGSHQLSYGDCPPPCSSFTLTSLTDDTLGSTSPDGGTNAILYRKLYSV